MPIALCSGWTPARPLLMRLTIVFIALLLATPAAMPAGAQRANGCAGELAGAWGAECPVVPEDAAYIEYVLSTAYGVSIRMTPEGVMYGTTCEGAAHLVRIASGLYSQLPADQRSQADLFWAEPYITSEVMAHSVLSATGIPELASHGNPIDIVFADYSTPGSQGLFWHSLDDPNFPFSPGSCAGNV